MEDYSLKLMRLYKYASSLMSNPRDEMSRFLTDVFRYCDGKVWYNHAPW